MHRDTPTVNSLLFTPTEIMPKVILVAFASLLFCRQSFWKALSQKQDLDPSPTSSWDWSTCVPHDAAGVKVKSSVVHNCAPGGREVQARQNWATVQYKMKFLHSETSHYHTEPTRKTVKTTVILSDWDQLHFQSPCTASTLTAQLEWRCLCKQENIDKVKTFSFKKVEIILSLLDHFLCVRCRGPC